MKATLPILVAFSVSFCGSNYAADLQNLDVIKKDYVHYYQSGHYEKDQQKVGEQALAYLKDRLQQPHQKPYAIVFDIDETSLSNYPNMAKMNFGGSDEQEDAAEAEAKDPAIKSTLKLYNFAKENHVAIFFVTGRREFRRTPTEKNLKDVGYAVWDALYLKPMDYHEKTAAIYKTKVRADIESKGYDIVLNIGDQLSDLEGGHADRTFKMPNPFYYIP